MIHSIYDLCNLLLFSYLFLINMLTWALYGVDKTRAKHGQWRVPEKWLIGLAFLGGSLGAWVGMICFHHKTQHWYFQILIPLSCFLWIGGLVFYWMYFEHVSLSVGI